jgi:hypothetical protein
VSKLCWVVKICNRLFVFYFSFVNQYRVCILYGNYINLFERTSDFHDREFEFGF